MGRRKGETRALRPEQERRIQDLFVVRPGFVEPFPESSIRRAVAISEERAPAPSNQTAKTAEPGGIRIEGNSNFALVIGVIFAGFVTWVVGRISKGIGGEKGPFWRHVAVESLATLVSGFILYSFGLVDEVKLLTIPLAGGLSMVVISAVKFS